MVYVLVTGTCLNGGYVIVFKSATIVREIGEYMGLYDTVLCEECMLHH